MWNFKNAAILLAVCLLVSQCIQQQAVPALAYVITSQYLGATPSRGDEHLLLFKIPEPISSQLLESRQSFQPTHEQQQQQQYLAAREPRLLVQANQEPVILTPQQALYQQQVLSHGPHIQSTPRFRYEPASSTIVQEQAVSLTIPLSTVNSLELEQQQHQPTPPLNFMSANQYNQDLQQQQPLASKQVALELALADYLSSMNQPKSAPYNQQQNQAARNQLGSAVSVDRALKNADSQNVFMIQNRLQMVGGGQPETLSPASMNHDPQLGQLANLSLQTSHTTGLNPFVLQNETLGAELQYTAQPTLWRETQPQLQYGLNPSTNHQQVSPNQSEIASLIAKLSSSSPELLIRLRSLLKRAANVKYQSAHPLAGSSADAPAYAIGGANQTSIGGGPRLFDRSLKHVQQGVDGDSELLLANNASDRELNNLVQEYLNRQQPLNSRASPLSGPFGQQSLSTLVSSQNVTSHEEIKIPLIVIAMPRILALRHNHMSTSAGLPITGSSYNSSRLPTITSELSQSLIRQHLPQILVTNFTSSVSPSSESADSQPTLMHQPAHQSNSSSHLNTSQAFWVGQGQITSTTSLPLHTMAPYAQQFIMPGLASAPLIRNEFVPIQQPQQQHSFIYPSNRTSYLMPSANGQAAGGQFRAISESMLVARQNGRASNQLLPPLGNSGNNMQIRPIDLAQGSVSDNQPYKSNSHIQLVSHSQQPLYEIRQEADATPDDDEASNQQQAYIYSNTAPERRANITDGAQRASLNDLQQAERSLQLTPMKSRATLFEEQIARLRPLFQSPIKRQQTSNHLTPSQMLALLSRANERRIAPGGRLQQLGAINADLGLGARLGASGAQKQSPEMLFMVV